MQDVDMWHRAVGEARLRIADFAARTPVVLSDPLAGQLGHPVWFKCEQFQPMGAFKIRGAANALVALRDRGQLLGAVTYSTGNHGLAVACVAQKLGIPAIICISRHVPDNKVAALRARGAEIVIDGESQDDAHVRAEQLAQERDFALIEPFDDPDVIAGQGTIAAEILEQVPDVAQVVVPVSGGGLAAGVGVELKAQRPDVHVVGVSMEGGAVMYESLKRGFPVQMPESPTLADSLQGGIGLGNRWTMQMVGEFVDEMILVSETEISQAMGFLAVEEGIVVEGAAAVTAAWLRRGKALPGPAVAILTGRNVDGTVVASLMAEYTDTRLQHNPIP